MRQVVLSTSNFIGLQAGYRAKNASNSNFWVCCWAGATNADSNFSLMQASSKECLLVKFH
jgi:hypothetical protein